MTTITISRQFGAGGRTLGKKLAKRLGYYCADDVMVKEVADRMNVSPKEVQGFEKEGASNLMKILDRFLSGDYISRLISDRYGYVYEKKYVESKTCLTLRVPLGGGGGSSTLRADLCTSSTNS